MKMFKMQSFIYSLKQKLVPISHVVTLPCLLGGDGAQRSPFRDISCSKDGYETEYKKTS